MACTHYALDWETLSNCSVLCVEDYKEDVKQVFVIHELRDDTNALIDFLRKCRDDGSFHITFNGNAFDAQINQWILEGDFDHWGTPEEKARSIYRKAQEVVDKSNKREFQQYPEWKLSIQQIDMFKLLHLDNPSKSSSLKWCQFSMDWYNVQEMPIHHTHEITTMEEIETIIGYCQNDVSSTKAIMLRSKEQINLRNTLTNEYGINLRSASEPKISKDLFIHFLSEKTGISKYELKQMSTKRDIVDVSSIILPYTTFSTPVFKQLLIGFNNLKLNPNNTKGGFKYSINYNGVQTNYGLGGIHGAKKSGIYESKDEMIIMTSDVTSYYPNLAIRNKWAPAHISKEDFCQQYEWFFDQRQVIPKKDPKNYVYKIILNATFGLTIDKHSPFYDPLMGMQITINGQLSLSMLYEMISERIPESIPLMQNTDGLETIIPENKKDEYLSICKEWEDITKLKLEHDQYKKLVLRDCNNYLAINMQGKVKCKGIYEYEDLPLHKNKSHLIIPKALYAFFVNDIVPEQYLQQNRNIFDYCGGVKSKGEWYFKETCVINGVLQERRLQKVVRYYISTKGCKILKYNPDGRHIQIESGQWMQQEFNQYQEKPWEEYKVNEAYYLDKIYTEIGNIKAPVSNQMSLFS